MAETSPTTRTQTRRKTTATDRSTAAKKAAATRARNQASTARKRSTAAKKAAETRGEQQRTPVERVVTIQVGAALTARDTVVSTVGDLASRFERRGESARTRVERDLRGVRRDVEAQAGLVGSRIENLVQVGITAGTQVAAKATERVARVL